MKHREALKIPSYCCNNPDMLLDNPFSCKLLYMVRTCVQTIYIFLCNKNFQIKTNQF